MDILDYRICIIPIYKFLSQDLPGKKVARSGKKLQGYFSWRQNFEFELKRIMLHWIQTVSFGYSEVNWIVFIKYSVSYYFWAYIQLNIIRNPWNIPLQSFHPSVTAIKPLSSGNEKMVSLVFTMTLYVSMTTISHCKVYGTWNQVIFKLAKHPKQRSHSKTHWIRIENLQTKHEAWGCFKLNNTPLYNKKWVLIFFSYMELQPVHTKKCLHANFLQMSNSTVVQ